jgi:hypothetical protein
MKRTLIYLFTLFLSFEASAQLEGIYVEKYYITDISDTTDTANGGVELGETTYRIYLDLIAGSKLLSLFGDAAHPFEISSTDRFFNNRDGATFGYDIPKIAYESNTVALDTYITLGQVGKQGTNNFFGLPKHQDVDGSFIGGVNNDGGSEIIDGGLLVNNDPEAGIPITESDGIDTLNLVIPDWFSFGILDFASGEDTTIFNVDAIENHFISTQFILSAEGVYGVNPDSNYVLIAQLTTPGELEFRFNTSILTNTGDTLEYVGTNEVLNENQIFAPFLVFPQVCGCTDPEYIEYSAVYPCSQEGACQNLVVLGCMDSLACNYNPFANLEIESLCCYPGFCQERDLEEVCPQLKGESFDFKVFPNPASNSATVQVLSGVNSDVSIEIFDYNGVVVYSEFIPDAPLNYSTQVNTVQFPTGLYVIRVTGINEVQHVTLAKL